jgi:antirestriction protein ArdC
METEMRKNIREEITAKVIALMEEHGTGFILPFASMSGWPTNATTGARYNGINVLMLGLFGRGCTLWASYKQWAAAGAQVRRGEKGTPIVFYKTGKGERTNSATGHAESFSYPILRHSTVFGADQVDGCPQSILDKHAPDNGTDLTERLDAVDRYIDNCGATVEHGSLTGAFYSPATDSVHMPAREAFSATDTSTATECYYSTYLHELGHWTGARSRLDRLGDKNKRGYAYEELIAELTAAFQCKLLGISSEPRPDHAQYLNGWLQALKSDTSYIFKASAQAQKAVQFMDALQAESESIAA